MDIAHVPQFFPKSIIIPRKLRVFIFLTYADFRYQFAHFCFEFLVPVIAIWVVAGNVVKTEVRGEFVPYYWGIH